MIMSSEENKRAERGVGCDFADSEHCQSPTAAAQNNSERERDSHSSFGFCLWPRPQLLHFYSNGFVSFTTEYESAVMVKWEIAQVNLQKKAQTAGSPGMCLPGLPFWKHVASSAWH